MSEKPVPVGEPVAFRKLVLVTFAALAVGVGTGALVMYMRSGGGPGPTPFDDQPPIIVSDGSIYFDGGDKYNPNKGQDAWTKIGNSNQHWRALKTTGTGHHVASFTVYIAGVVDPQNCPQETMAGDHVDLDYTSEGTTWNFHLQHTYDGTSNGNGTQHHSPQLDSDQTDLNLRTVGSDPPQLYAGSAGQGRVSRIAVTDSSGVTATCTLTAASPQVRISIVPERH